MKLKHFASSAAIATATIAAPAITVVQPAAAATTVYTSNGAYAQLDKSPSGGAASWIWWFGGSTGETWVDYKFYNDRIIRHTGKVEEGVTSSITPGQDVWQIRVCNHYYSGRTTSRIVPTGADRRTSLAFAASTQRTPSAHACDATRWPDRQVRVGTPDEAGCQPPSCRILPSKGRLRPPQFVPIGVTRQFIQVAGTELRGEP